MDSKQIPQLTDDLIKQLFQEAKQVRSFAYAPYSQFLVGSVIIDDQGNKYQGCNVENASYGLTVCAERNAIFSGVSKGMKKIRYLLVVGDTPDPTPPCGACREVINEFSDENTKIILTNLQEKTKIFTLNEILPFAFKKENLEVFQQNKK